MGKLCNIKITDTNKRELFVERKELQILVPMNAECFVKSNNDETLMTFINSECRTTIDGQIPLWIYKNIYKNDDIEKLSGSDLIYDFCEYAIGKGDRVFLLGGKEKSNIEAVKRLRQKYPKLNIDGFSPTYEPYPFSDTNNDNIKQKISSYKPDILFVGFGFGKQERWISDNLDFLKEQGLKWAVCSGGTYEFISGECKRAPKLVQSIGLEGVWRLIIEPKAFRLKRLITSLKIFKYAYTK